MGMIFKKCKLVLFFVFFSLCLSGYLSRAESKNVKMVVTAAFVSDKGVIVYEEIAAYVKKKLGWDVMVVSGLSCTETDEMLDTGIIQVGYV